VTHEVLTYEDPSCGTCYADPRCRLQCEIFSDCRKRCAHSLFMDELNEPQFRAQIKNVVHTFAGLERPIVTAAVINGSRTGTGLGLPEGTQFGKMEWTTLDLTLRTARPGTLTEVFFGDSARPFDELHYRFREPAFMESAPGGTRPTYAQVRDSLIAADYTWNRRFRPDFVDHAFIPSASGAGMLDGPVHDPGFWLQGLDARDMKMSMFDVVHAPEQNQGHVVVTTENKAWLRALIRDHGPQSEPQSVQPFVRRVCRNSDDSLSATFGYRNPNAFVVAIALGDRNRFSGIGIDEDMGQPQAFAVGEQLSAVSIRFAGRFTGRGAPTWTLDGTSVEASIPPLPEPCPVVLP
jgi:hypothetical protein